MKHVQLIRLLKIKYITFKRLQILYFNASDGFSYYLLFRLQYDEHFLYSENQVSMVFDGDGSV